MGASPLSEGSGAISQQLKLEPTTARYTDDSEILDLLIREAIKIFDAQPDWQSDYVGYLKNERLWEVIVIDKDGRDIGSLFFERMTEIEDFDTVVPNENYDWLGEHQGYWWRACEFLEDALYERDLETEIAKLAALPANQQADKSPLPDDNSDPFAEGISIGFGLIPTNIPASDTAYAQECLNQ